MGEKHGCHSQCRLRHETIDRAIQSVIREQKSQKLKGVVDPCAISEAYFCNGAKKFADDAHRIGICDEREVAAFENSNKEKKKKKKKKYILKVCRKIFGMKKSDAELDTKEESIQFNEASRTMTMNDSSGSDWADF